MSPTPPAAPRRPRELTAHGDVRVDDWFWLRSDDRSDQEVLDHLVAENEFVAASLSHTDDLQAALFAEMKARIKETDLSVPFRKDGRWFYTRTEEGQQYPILCRTAIEPDPKLPEGAAVPGEEVLLDMNVLAGDSDYFGMGAYDLAPSQDLLLYSTDHDGSERFVMRIRDLRTGTDLEDVIPETTYGTAWAGDSTFFYVRQDAAMRPHQVWRHEVGASPSDDVLVYEDLDERFFVSVGLSLTEQWVQISSSSKVTTEPRST
jgi:oligopeptidase B